MKSYKIASIAGDGIGKEVVPESLKVLKEAAKKHQFKIAFDEFDFSSCDYLCSQTKTIAGISSLFERMISATWPLFCPILSAVLSRPVTSHVLSCPVLSEHTIMQSK